MKKVFILMLTLVMLLSVVACGDNTAAEYDNNAEPEMTGNSTESTDPQIKDIDTSWASNEFEMLIPEPPFDDWKKETTNEGVYRMSRFVPLEQGKEKALEQMKSDSAIFADYIRSLEDYGFTIDSDTLGEEMFSGTATNRANTEVFFMAANADFLLEISTGK